MVGLPDFGCHYKIRTICKPIWFWPFKIQTIPVFQSHYTGHKHCTFLFASASLSSSSSLEPGTLGATKFWAPLASSSFDSNSRILWLSFRLDDSSLASRSVKSSTRVWRTSLWPPDDSWKKIVEKLYYFKVVIFTRKLLQWISSLNMKCSALSSCMFMSGFQMVLTLTREWIENHL